jgi:hypothetical protein
MKVIKLSEQEFLTPNDLQRGPDIKKAIKNTPVLSIPFEEAKNKLPLNILEEKNGNFVLYTLEGPRPLDKNDVILYQEKGKGKFWAVDQKTFEKGFANSGKTKDGWKIVYPRDPVRAWKINRKFKVKVSWGEQESEDNGGMLVQKISNPEDYWIASFKDFENYTVLGE